MEKNKLTKVRLESSFTDLSQNATYQGSYESEFSYHRNVV